MQKPQVVIDTNIFISGLIIPKSYPYQVLLLWQKGAFQLVTSVFLVNEVSEVLQRPKIQQKYHVNELRVQEIMHLISVHSRMVVPKANQLQVRDQKDQVVLETALSGKADFLITGDDDLLSLAQDKGLKGLEIISPRQFVSDLSEQANYR